MGRRTLSRLGIAILLGPALLASCATSDNRGPRLDGPAKEEAVLLAKFHEHAAGESLAWDVTKRPLKARPWLAAGPSERIRLEMLGNLAADESRFFMEATDVLQRMVRRARVGAETLALGLDETQPTSELIVERELETLSMLDTTESRLAWQRALLHALPDAEPHPGRLLRILSALPAYPFVRAWIWNHARNEWRGENWRDFETARVYLPPAAPVNADGRTTSPSVDDLLARHAPIIVQEVDTSTHADPRDDQIGRAELLPDRRGNPVAHVDTEHPTVYAWTSEALVSGSWLTQLNYQFWYHDHPPSKNRDPEAGSTEGAMIRITLDEGNVPLLSEAVYACGCYHRIYPCERLENSARAEFGEAESGLYSLAKKQGARIDAVIPELSADPREGATHPIVYVRSGFHLIAMVAFDEEIPEQAESESYELRPAEDLERIPWGTRRASFFRRDGLVRGADRPEAWMMYPSGIYHAGTPRIRGEHKIHFDQYEYDDPNLLNTMLRIPQLDRSN